VTNYQAAWAELAAWCGLPEQTQFSTESIAKDSQRDAFLSRGQLAGLAGAATRLEQQQQDWRLELERFQAAFDLDTLHTDLA